ncbi:hypothetical protein F4780DRAFT_739490, partial [Xylariomycetidae sp. FL0641]
MKRAGARPAVPGTVAPQRQTSETAGEQGVRRATAFLRRVARENAGVFEVKGSRLEHPAYDALWLRGELLEAGGEGKRGEEEEQQMIFPARARGELAHVHPEGSTHATLSPADGAAAVAAGWGERHKLSGVYLSWGYVLLYAPRDEAEWAVWRELVLAGARFGAALVGVEGVVEPE